MASASTAQGSSARAPANDQSGIPQAEHRHDFKRVGSPGWNGLLANWAWSHVLRDDTCGSSIQIRDIRVKIGTEKNRTQSCRHQGHTRKTRQEAYREVDTIPELERDAETVEKGKQVGKKRKEDNRSRTKKPGSGKQHQA